VPRIFLAKVPKGLADVKRVEERKAAFLRVMLPLVLEATERVLPQRAQLRVIDAKLAADMTLTPDQERRLNAIAAEYRTARQEVLYQEGLQAIGQRAWATAVKKLEQVKPYYKDTAANIALARSQLEQTAPTSTPKAVRKAKRRPPAATETKLAKQPVTLPEPPSPSADDEPVDTFGDTAVGSLVEMPFDSAIKHDALEVDDRQIVLESRRQQIEVAIAANLQHVAIHLREDVRQDVVVGLDAQRLVRTLFDAQAADGRKEDAVASTYASSFRDDVSGPLENVGSGASTSVIVAGAGEQRDAREKKH